MIFLGLGYTMPLYWGKRALGIRLAYHNIQKWMNSDTKIPGVIFSHTLFKHTILFEVKKTNHVSKHDSENYQGS